MKDNIEKNLEKVVEITTRKAAKEEWKIASEKQRVPLYNYRFDHIKEVVNLAKYIAIGTEANMDVIILAAWLHDVAKPGIGGISAEHHGIASAEIAEEILLEEGIDLEMIAQVSDVIRKHVGLTIKETLEPIEAQILWEADKILKLGIVGVLQYVLNGVRIFPGQDLEEIGVKLREFLPLAQDLANCVVTERGREIATQRLERLQILSQMLDSELNPGAEKGEG
ncbi:HD domain-containing protein [Candidatus Thorarchaeota archaeon]|nr:MAG: HD domain-containing protein [Candidatus Thorarchaeota archaeon]